MAEYKPVIMFLFVTDQYVPDWAAAQRLIKGKDCGSGNPEGELSPFAFQHFHGCFGGCHFGHRCTPPVTVLGMADAYYVTPLKYWGAPSAEKSTPSLPYGL
jgi:hypothetical protein